jgi:hypothetical protein
MVRGSIDNRGFQPFNDLHMNSRTVSHGLVALRLAMLAVHNILDWRPVRTEANR